MPLKIHLLIVSCIIAAVYIIWELMHVTGAPSPANNDPKAIPRLIAVTHASLGLNCRNIAITNEATPHDAFSSSKPQNPKLSEDNVFSAVSLKCNGSTECTIAVDDPELGEDPAPDCTPKTLEIEYRCFSYDRPWRVKASTGTVKLLCATTDKK